MLSIDPRTYQSARWGLLLQLQIPHVYSSCRAFRYTFQRTPTMRGRCYVSSSAAASAWSDVLPRLSGFIIIILLFLLKIKYT
jgi:hypothetical protein